MISNEAAIATIVDVLRLRAETQREEIAYRFLEITQRVLEVHRCS